MKVYHHLHLDYCLPHSCCSHKPDDVATGLHQVIADPRGYRILFNLRVYIVLVPLTMTKGFQLELGFRVRDKVFRLGLGLSFFRLRLEFGVTVRVRVSSSYLRCCSNVARPVTTQSQSALAGPEIELTIIPNSRTMALIHVPIKTDKQPEGKYIFSSLFFFTSQP